MKIHIIDVEVYFHNLLDQRKQIYFKNEPTVGEIYNELGINIEDVRMTSNDISYIETNGNIFRCYSKEVEVIDNGN